jgi:hypothetical protein
MGRSYTPNPGGLGTTYTQYRITTCNADARIIALDNIFLRNSYKSLMLKSFILWFFVG